jgi:prepilin-type N-terminal cleavage/methylation domain-containing protein
MNAPRFGRPTRMDRLCSTRTPQAFTLIELLVTISLIALLAGLALPVISNAKGKAISVHCQGNLRQLGMAIRVHAGDNDGRLPIIEIRTPANPDTVPLVRALQGISAELVRCRGDKEQYYRTNGSSYDWNSALNGRLLHTTPSDQALLHDHGTWHGYQNAVFPDGHTARLTAVFPIRQGP